MASKRIVERAKKASLYTKDLLLDEDDEIEDEECTEDEEDDDDEEDEDAAPSADGTAQNENDGEKTVATKSDKMEKENVALEKLANKFVDDLLQLKKHYQGFKLNAETQTTEHRNEVKRLNTELKNATKCMEKIKATNEEQMNEISRLKKELETTTTQKEGLVKCFENTETSLRSEVQKLDLCLQQATEEKTEQAERILQMQGDMQTAESQAALSNAENVKLLQKLRDTACEKERLNSQLEASKAKISELKRAIQILESDPFTTTTAQAQSGESFSCPVCGGEFSSLANMQIHAEDCNG
uniref:C2H2-type domain-containing protein n=1 Tax=Anopheles maculatus TaxID=74869 RepID=A0A182T802_9DIPT